MTPLRLSGVSALETDPQDEVVAELTTAHPELVLVRYRQRPGWSPGEPAWADREIWFRQLCIDGSTVEAPAGCLACAIVDDLRRLLPELAETRWARDLVVALPAGVSAHTVLDAVASLEQEDASSVPGSSLNVSIGTIIVALQAGSLEDQLWAGESLADARVAVAEGDLALGEFLVGELLLCDTHALVGRGLDPAPVELVRHIASQAQTVEVEPAGAPWIFPPPRHGSRFDEREASARTSAGTVTMPIRVVDRVIRSHLVRVARPLHPGRLAEVLPSVAAGCVWTRGRLWVASMPARRIAWAGVGPNISFADAGGWLADGPQRFQLDSTFLLDWHPVYGDRGSVLAFTGRDVIPAELNAVLDHCQLTQDELALGLEHWARQPDPLDLRSVLGHSHLMINEPEPE